MRGGSSFQLARHKVLSIFPPAHSQNKKHDAQNITEQLLNGLGEIVDRAQGRRVGVELTCLHAYADMDVCSFADPGSPCWTSWGQLESHVAKVPHLPAKMPRLPCKSGHKNRHQKAVLGSWGQLGRHVGPLGAVSGTMVNVSGPTWVPAGAMLHLSGPTWSDAGPLATAWVPTWMPCWTPWGQLEGHVAKVPRLPAKREPCG